MTDQIERVQADGGDALAELLDRREELGAYMTEFHRVNKVIKALLGDRETVRAGDWLVQGRWVDRKAQEASRFFLRTYTRQGGKT